MNDWQKDGFQPWGREIYKEYSYTVFFLLPHDRVVEVCFI